MKRFFLCQAHRGAVRRRAPAAGYTLISTAVTVVVASIVLTGAWMTYVGYQAQWKVSNTDRVMDQYAASTLQEMTNLLSWSWGGKQIESGVNMRWKFIMNDQVGEYQPMALWDVSHYRRDPQGFIELTYNPNLGVLYNGAPPRWARDQMGTSWYHWIGKPSVPTVRGTMDARDHMTVESMSVDINEFRAAGFVPSRGDAARLQMVLKVEIVMHYTSNNPTFFGLYNRGYVRERRYTTQIAMRNWDVEHNDFRDQQVTAAESS